MRWGEWRKSSYSTKEECVEVGSAPGLAGIRDTKDPGGPVLLVCSTAFVRFLGAVRTGRFDRDSP